MAEAPQNYKDAWAALTERLQDELRDLADEWANGEQLPPSPALFHALLPFGVVFKPGFIRDSARHDDILVSPDFLAWALEHE